MSKTKINLLVILFLAILTATVRAQPSGQGEQGDRPGPGYGMGPGMMGPGWGPGYGMGSGMMGPGWEHRHHHMGPGMMGPGWGYGHHMGPGMMGPGWGYGPGYGWGPGMRGPGPETELTPEEREARAKAFVEEYIRRYLPGYRLEKKEGSKKK